MPLLRPCIGAGGQPCPTRALTKDRSGRCETCRRRHWNAAGSSTQRGYGTAHRALREQYRPLVEAGRVTCWRCGELIAPHEPWDLGHDDNDRGEYRGPEHRDCNRATKVH